MVKFSVDEHTGGTTKGGEKPLPVAETYQLRRHAYSRLGSHSYGAFRLLLLPVTPSKARSYFTLRNQHYGEIVPQAGEPLAREGWPFRLARSSLSAFDRCERGGVEWYCRSTPPKERYVVSEEPISLGALAYVCNVYDVMTDFGSSFREFQRNVHAKPDLDDPNHRRDLLRWLNAWGCRHLALRCHPDVSRELGAWHTSARGRLPGTTDRLVDMSDEALEKFGELFDHLSSLPAREGERNGRRFPISFGPTAASKTLFALRPHVFVPWDEAIRQGFSADGSGASYVRFLKGARHEASAIAEQCSREGLDVEDLPKRLGRGDSTTAQLIGEYYWIKVTRNVKPPDATTLREWLAWS